MKKVKTRTVQSFLLMFVLFTTMTGCGKKDDDSLASRLKDLDKDIPEAAYADKSLRDLEKKVADLEKPVDAVISNEMDKGYYYKMLGLKYMDYAMYGKALDSFKMALKIYPENQNILYKAGLCASQLALTEISSSDRQAYLDTARFSYERALELRPEYKRVLYALSVLLIFELDSEQAAAPYLDKLLSIDPEHVNGLFLRARVYASQGAIEEAIDVYGKIEKIVPNTEEALKAARNKDALLKELSRG